MTHAELLTLLASIDRNRQRLHEAEQRLALYTPAPFSAYENEIRRVSDQTIELMVMADDGCPNGNDE